MKLHRSVGWTGQENKRQIFGCKPIEYNIVRWRESTAHELNKLPSRNQHQWLIKLGYFEQASGTMKNVGTCLFLHNVKVVFRDPSFLSLLVVQSRITHFNAQWNYNLFETKHYLQDSSSESNGLAENRAVYLGCLPNCFVRIRREAVMSLYFGRSNSAYQCFQATVVVPYGQNTNEANSHGAHHTAVCSCSVSKEYSPILFDNNQEFSDCFFVGRTF